MNGDSDDWWNKAIEEKKSAGVLKASGQWRQCYHHTGQCIEFSLKAIYLKRNGLNQMPDECKNAKWHSQSLEVIKENANINTEFGGLKSDTRLYSNWMTVRDWDSNARFPSQHISKQTVLDISVAAFNLTKGVFGWLEEIFQKS